MRSRTLVTLNAHPDDESSKAAGTVACYADQGVRCVLVVATGGEEGDILNPAMDLPEVRANLTALRRRELTEAARIIGYDEIVSLGYRDSGMRGSEANGRPDAFVNVARDEALASIVAVIRRERPQVVIGYDDHRYYPHPDHVRIHELGLEAFEAAADADRFPGAGPAWQVARLYAAVFSRERIRRLHEAALARGIESPLTHWLEAFDEEEADRVDARVAIHTTLGRARAALRAHRTQVDPDGFWFRIPEELVLDVYPYEDFELLRAAAAQPASLVDDLFAGI